MITLLGIIIISIAIGTVIYLLKGPDPQVPLILNSIAIRNVGNNSVLKAKIIDEMDNNIERIKNKETLDKWDELTGCLDAGCSDDILSDFILTIVISEPNKIPSAKLIADIIIVGRFWGVGEVLKFSKALSAANDAISQINSKEIDKKWEQIVACNGNCPEKNNLIFDEIRFIVEQGNQK